MRTFTASELAELNKRYRTNFINSLSGFKSLQLLGTISLEGKSNLAIFNSIFHIGANPPQLGLVVRPDGPEHDTLNNIRETGYYTLNNVQESYYRQAHQTSARYPSGQSEFEACGLMPVFIEDFSVPFVSNASVRIGLKLKEILAVNNGTHIVIGEVELVQLNEKCLSADGFADLAAAGSITIAGLDTYYRTEKIARLAYAKPDEETKEL
ncbi:MAG: flavin reductase family protein [Sphingobacteriaceae bacterium]